MLQVNVFEDHVMEYERWFEENPEIYQSEVLAVREQMLKLPKDIHGIEVGVGTGRFSAPLGIKEGVEPSKNMIDRAIKRGIEVMNATAERLPYKALSQDFVLFVTVCHLDDVRQAFKEAHRVLKNNGTIIVGFLPASGEAAQSYQERRPYSKFYRNARFYEPETITGLLGETGFQQFDYVQTLFGKLDEIDEIQSPKEGFDEGSFVVVKATKK
jgi:ubiquinone/menaquinone biosynthesis C-methylase UbiE